MEVYFVILLIFGLCILYWCLRYDEDIVISRLKRDDPDYLVKRKSSSEGHKQMAIIREKLGVANLHRKGQIGRNVRIGLLDEGLLPSGWMECNYELKHRPDQHGFHASHISGIIDNLAPGATIVSYKCIGADVDVYSSLGYSFEKCLSDPNMDIINLSMECSSFYGRGDECKIPFRGALISIFDIYEIFRKNGILVVISVGNRGSVKDLSQKMSSLTQSVHSSPWRYLEKERSPRFSDWPIVVSSCDLDYRISPFNSVNRTIDCITFGENIYSFPHTSKRAPYETSSGTSMAAPQVTGCLALIVSYLKSRYPSLHKRSRGEIARTYLLNQCTIRNMKGALQSFPLPERFNEIKRLIEQKASDKIISSKVFLLFREVTKDNPQFREIGMGITPENCIERFMKLKQYISHKYTIHCIGYGFINIPEDFRPRELYPEEMKPLHDLRPLER